MFDSLRNVMLSGTPGPYKVAEAVVGDGYVANTNDVILVEGSNPKDLEMISCVLNEVPKMMLALEACDVMLSKFRFDIMHGKQVSTLRDKLGELFNG